MGLAQQEQAKEDQARAAELAPAMRVNWSDMPEYDFRALREDRRMKRSTGTSWWKAQWKASASRRRTLRINVSMHISRKIQSTSLPSAKPPRIFSAICSARITPPQWSARWWRWKVQLTGLATTPTQEF